MQHDAGRFGITLTMCCVPTICQKGGELIRLDELSDAVKIICTNDTCEEGHYMHKACFDQWEGTVLTYFRSTGRARSWSEKQRLQNLWTKKGYDLAFKACGCKCGKGHLRKDLDWIPPVEPDLAKKKKHRKKKNDKPSLSITGFASASASATTTRPSFPIVPQQVPVNRFRRSSMSSMSSTAGSPPMYGSSDYPVSPSWSHKGFPSWSHKGFSHRDQERNASNIFCRRQDYSSFNSLPPNKINPYHIKMEDDNQGNDEIRTFILNTLYASNMLGVNCIFCISHMTIFDRYPLVDGTFFLSPLQYSGTSIPVSFGDEVQFLSAICMSCLEGWNTVLICKFCQKRWNGSMLILGTMYMYDVIAANPCCEERLRCNGCKSVVMDRRLQFFSDYSHQLTCPYCGLTDYHFIKPAVTYEVKRQF